MWNYRNFRRNKLNKDAVRFYSDCIFFEEEKEWLLVVVMLVLAKVITQVTHPETVEIPRIPYSWL